MILVDLKYSFIHQTILLQAFLLLSAMIINSSSFMQPGSQEMICVKWRGHNSLFSAKESEGFLRFLSCRQFEELTCECPYVLFPAKEIYCGCLVKQWIERVGIVRYIKMTEQGGLPIQACLTYRRKTNRSKQIKVTDMYNINSGFVYDNFFSIF
ncbi:hypothetical protein KFK09_025548 [Dendrobium nobile]|uniref:Uncharacterized protein n=1 Tax=Dendrobium nobile TaxID=94219 RepID=A0A8T3A576_DENNO|nr:hypothetical protein KFK09_025548 [Dendrobium nobile]